MTTYNQEKKVTYTPEAKKTVEANKPEYIYQQYQPVEEYKSDDYWMPAYEDIQKKYDSVKYPAKQYATPEKPEVYGKETADYVIAGKEHNWVETYGDNDVIEAGYGNDKIDAGEGDDWLWGISKEHNAADKKYAQPEYEEIDWYTAGEGKDIYALGTEKHAHYATNGIKDYAVLTDYTAEDTVMLHGTAKNYVVGQSTSKTEDPTKVETVATLYWDKDESGAYSEGDDMVAVFEGYSTAEITAAKDSWMYVKTETPAV